MKPISFYQLTILDDCENCFWLYATKGVNRPRGPFSQLPNRFERLLLESYQENRDAGGLPADLDLPGYKLLDGDQHLEWKNKGLKYHDTERDIVLLAKPDEILVKDDRYLIGDYKTKASPREKNSESKLHEDIQKYRYNVQASYYNHIFEKAGYKMEDRGLLVFYFLDSIQGNQINFSPKQVFIDLDKKDIERRLDQVVEVLARDESPDENCEWCVGPEVRLEMKNG